MSDLPATSSTLPPPAQGEGWTRNKFVFFIALALTFHVVLIVVFGTKKQIVPRVVEKIPHLQLADNSSEFIALGDPTLFARPNTHDFVGAFWQRTQPVQPPAFNWTEPPRYLLPSPENFGASFREFLQASQPDEVPLNFKPEPRLIAPVVALDNAIPQKTTMQITGELAQRRLLSQVEQPPILVNDVIPPSKVQALVDTAGNVASVVLLESSTLDIADQRGLQIARNLRFAPAPRLMFGEIIFTWHTVPTNAP